ncbi:P-loop containing nucleoside triphosphate hydrolase protein [Nemania diffusa]|nr:P-loop containing nucleoside triphosphate hydrolase protein [Nemania diffusa]
MPKQKNKAGALFSSVSPTPSNKSSTIASSSPNTQLASTNATTVVESVAGVVSSVSGDASSNRSQSQPSEARNFADPAFRDIIKEYNDALGDIQVLGVSHVAVLPELVLVGDQSSGKSSLMSALARLNLPTSSGICTRCPFHIRMSSSKDSHWSCTISLQQAYEYRPSPNRPVKQSDVTKRNPFPPWVLKPSPETVVFKTIYEQNSTTIDEVLRWAQIATLNPSQNPAQFVPAEGNYAKETPLEDAKRSTEAKFSPNVVSLELKGSCFTDLSFFDLPGIFAVAEVTGDDYLVDVVENLTRMYVGREEAIIMLALPMDHDIDNSRTLKIIRELNAEARTIGVLTKADRPDFNIPGTIDSWLAVLNEKKQKVKRNGFYITSLPPNPKEGIESFTTWEESFFRADVNKWPRAFDNYVDRCGIDQLRSYLMKELASAFAGSLPNITEKFKNSLEEIRGHLNELPDLPQNIEHQVQMSLRDFCNSAKSAVSNQEFEQGCKETVEAFYQCLIELKPRCQLNPEKVKPRSEEVIIISDESDNDVTGSKRIASRISAIGSTPKRQRRNELFTTPVKAEGSPASAAFRSPATPSSLAQNSNEKMVMNLVEIQKDIKLKTRGGFSDVVPLQVHETLCLKAVSRWEKPLELYIDKITTMLITAVTKALEVSLKDFSKRLIYKKCREFVEALLMEKVANQRGRLLGQYKNETYQAVTINEIGLNHSKAKEKEVLENQRLFTRAKAAGLIDEDRQFKRDEKMSPEEKAEQSKLLQKCQAQLPEDEFKRELDIAAKVRGYYLTAATRFVDGVSMDINSQLFRSFRDGALDGYLERMLGLFPYSPETYTRLMEEDEATAQNREQLRKELHKLETALKIILKLECSLTGYFEHNEKMEM